MKEFNRINREIVYKGAIIDFCKDTIITPKNHTVKWDLIKHKGAAAIIPVTNDGRIIMVRQWRNAVDKFSLEIPAGGLDGANEPTKVCAARELEEETGYTSEKIEFLQTLIPAIAYSQEKIDVYVAFNLKESQQNFDEDEDITLEIYSVEELLEKIMKNEVNDAKTVSAILTYYNKYCCNK